MEEAEEQIKYRHAKLRKAIYEHFDPDGDGYKSFINLLRAKLPVGLLSKAKDMYEVLNLMETEGVLGPGKYELLKTIVGQIDKPCLEIIQRAEEDIQRLRTTAAPELPVIVKVKEISASNEEKSRPTIEEVERCATDMIKGLYDDFKREKTSVPDNERMKRATELLDLTKVFCGLVKSISQKSIIFTIQFTSLARCQDLWKKYRSGELLQSLQRAFVTEDLKKRFSLVDIVLSVWISEEEYSLCCRRLAASGFGPSVTEVETSEAKDQEEMTHAEVTMWGKPADTEEMASTSEEGMAFATSGFRPSEPEVDILEATAEEMTHAEVTTSSQPEEMTSILQGRKTVDSTDAEKIQRKSETHEERDLGRKETTKPEEALELVETIEKKMGELSTRETLKGEEQFYEPEPLKEGQKMMFPSTSQHEQFGEQLEIPSSAEYLEQAYRSDPFKEMHKTVLHKQFGEQMEQSSKIEWSEEAKIRHSQLMNDISEYFSINRHEFRAFQGLLLDVMLHEQPIWIRYEPYVFVQSMEASGTISIGQYDILEHAAKTIGSKLFEIIQKAKEDIRQIQQGQVVVAKQVLSGEGYYDTTNKKGLFLCVVSDMYRPDYHFFLDFFHICTGFEVEVIPAENHTVDQIKSVFQKAKDIMNDSDRSKQYYCFFCAVFSDNGEIRTRDGEMNYEDIMKAFASDQMPGFKGPKLFLVFDWDTLHAQRPVQEPPTDQDVLIAYLPDLLCHRVVKMMRRHQYEYDFVEMLRMMPATVVSTLTKKLKLV